MITITEFFGNEPSFQYRNIALIHKKSIRDGFLASLSSFILMQLYLGFAKSSHANLYVASDEENNILGFIVLSFSTSKLYKEIVLKKFLIIVPLLIPRLISLNFLRKAIETLFYPYKEGILTGAKSELLNFCVDKDFRGLGIGEKLFQKVQESLKIRNIDCLKIVTGVNQIAAQKFYEKHNATLIGKQEVHKGAISLIYKYNLKNNF